MPKDDIIYLLKFAPQEAYIDDMMDGRLYMNAAGYHHGPPGEQGDQLEASLAYGMGVYANWLLPIYCMFTIRESDIVDKTVVIARRIIDEFRHVDGWMGIVRHDCFVRLLNRKIDSEIGLWTGPRTMRLGRIRTKPTCDRVAEYAATSKGAPSPYLTQRPSAISAAFFHDIRQRPNGQILK